MPSVRVNGSATEYVETLRLASRAGVDGSYAMPERQFVNGHSRSGQTDKRNPFSALAPLIAKDAADLARSRFAGLSLGCPLGPFRRWVVLQVLLQVACVEPPSAFGAGDLRNLYKHRLHD